MTTAAAPASPFVLAVFALLAVAAGATAQDAERLTVPPRLEQSFRSQVIGGTPDGRWAPGEPIRWRVEEVTPGGDSRIQFESVDPERYARERTAAAGHRSIQDRRPVPMFGIQF